MIEDREKVLQILASLDKKLYHQGRRDKLGFIIIGGTAFLLLQNHRVTEDIDVIILNAVKEEEIKILNEHQINNQVQCIIGFPPNEDFIEHKIKLELDFQCLEVFYPEPVYLILSKIFASRMYRKDLEDIVASGILDSINFEELEKLYDEYLGYNSSKHYWSIDEIKKEYIKYKKAN